MTETILDENEKKLKAGTIPGKYPSSVKKLRESGH